jgi:DHA1 family multidrug resistance protein-like MFS transporter
MGVFGSLWDVGHAGVPLLVALLIGMLGYGPAFAIVGAAVIGAMGILLIHPRDIGGFKT